MHLLSHPRLIHRQNDVTVWVRDPGGNVARQKFTSFVDTSSEFGASQLMKGAVGADVTQLQERLAVIDAAQNNIQTLAKDVVGLQAILSNKQTRGAFGQDHPQSAHNMVDKICRFFRF